MIHAMACEVIAETEEPLSRQSLADLVRRSQTTLGKLRNASQGWFQVENRDEATPERKTVRVVVDVEYEVK